MSTAANLPAAPVLGQPGGRRWLAGAEDLALTGALGLLVLVPLVEMTLRKVFHGSLSGASAFTQHLTLAVGMLGGAIAAREARLLSLGSVEAYLRGPYRILARVFAGSVAACIAVFLFVASAQFVQTEREAGRQLAYGVPAWVLQLVLPIGFALVALRIVKHASDRWRWRVAAGLLATVLVYLGIRPPAEPQEMVVPALALLLAATILGAPIFATLGGAALILFWGAEAPIASLTLDHYRLVTNPTLPTVPLFTLAGCLLAAGGASRRLIRLFRAMVGNLRGGPAILTVLVCAFFTSFTGASGVTILALGGLLMPVLLAAGYSKKNSLGLLTGTGSIGLLFPPCLPLIFYAVIAQVDLKQMFLGGVVPGLLLVGMTAAWGIRQAPPNTAPRLPFDWMELRRALWDSKWELLVPVIAFAGLFGGLATPVESAALTAFYAFVAETFIHRDLRITRDIPRVMTECGFMVGGILLILGVALGFTNYLVDAEIPARAVEWVTATVHSRWAFLLLLNLFLILVGALMDIYSAIVIVVPLMVPLGHAFGIDPIHLGIIFLVNAELGYLMPPVGENLFIASSRFGKPIGEVFRAVLPMVVIFLVAVALVTYVPALTLALPRWLAR